MGVGPGDPCDYLDRHAIIWDRLRQAAGTRPLGTVPTHLGTPLPTSAGEARQAKLG